MDDRLTEWANELVKLGLPRKQGMKQTNERIIEAEFYGPFTVGSHIPDLTHVGTVALIEEWACGILGWRGIDTTVDDFGMWTATTVGLRNPEYVFTSRWGAVLHLIMEGFREKAEEEERKRKAERFHTILSERAKTDLASLRITFREGRGKLNTMTPISYFPEARCVSGFPGIDGKAYMVSVAAIEEIESRVLRPEWVELV